MHSELFVTAVVFFAIYHITRLISDHFLRRKLIKAGQYEKAGILEQPKKSDEENKYPSLKWGLVALTIGIGLILINFYTDWNNEHENFALQFGILLISISVGFLVYLFIMNSLKKQ